MFDEYSYDKWTEDGRKGIIKRQKKKAMKAVTVQEHVCIDKMVDRANKYLGG